MNKTHKKALKFLCFTVLVLFGAPKTNVKLGPLPIYLIDLLILCVAYYTYRMSRVRLKITYKKLVILILVLITLNELINGLIFNVLLDSVYLTFRMSLAGCLYFIIPRVLQTPEHFLKVLKFGLAGGFITALLMVFSSLPMTRGVSNILLSNSYLTPNADNLSRHLIEAENVGIRGSSLVGVSILSGAFLNVIWPLLFILRSFSNLQGGLKYILYLSMILIPVGVVMTYSRGAILALLLVVIGMTIFQKGRSRLAIFTLSLLVFIGFSVIGFNSELFFFNRIVNRTNAVFEAPLEDQRESERIKAYSEPFEHLAKNFSYVLFGEGFARVRNGMTSEFSQGLNRADHAVFAKAYYAYGLITSLSIVSLFIGLAIKTLKSITQISKQYSFTFNYVRIMFVLLMGFSSWFSFGHAAVSTPRGAMLMFFVFGLVASWRNFYRAESITKISSKI